MLNREDCKAALQERLSALTGTSLEKASAYDKYAALVSLARDSIGYCWLDTTCCYDGQKQKQVYFFCIEFLPAPFQEINPGNRGIREVWLEVLTNLGINCAEHKAGLGQLAICFFGFLSSLGLPGHSCSIYYTYNLLEQAIVDGVQVTKSDIWLKDLNIWEYPEAVFVQFGQPLGTVKAVPYDSSVSGFDNQAVNTLRLWSTEIRDEFNANDSGLEPSDYRQLPEYKNWVEAILQILHPDDCSEECRRLRLVQEYFLVSTGLQSLVRHIKCEQGPDLSRLADHIAIHINDTHPALVIPELMRILMDEECLGWDEAWQITTHTISYASYADLPETLENWPVDHFQNLLPRIFEIVQEINKRSCDGDRIAAMTIIADGYVQMARLVMVGSHSVSGVAGLYSHHVPKSGC